jgi:hypothetical protein
MSTQKLLRDILSELPKGAYAEYGRKHIRINLPNGRFVMTACSPKDEDTACRVTLRKAMREMQR